MSGLAENPFDWQITKDRRVLIYRGGRLVVTAPAGELADRLDRADTEQAQQLLARATGNYRRGNERRVNRQR
jgi:predicted NAD/FAD-dependent oxidoreductase